MSTTHPSWPMIPDVLLWLTVIGAGELQGEMQQRNGAPALHHAAAAEDGSTSAPAPPERTAETLGTDLQPHEMAGDDDPCRPTNIGENEWIDRLNRRLFATVCASGRWFDRFFGAAGGSNDSQEASGVVWVTGIGTEYEGLQVRVRARLKVPLPNLSRRLHAFVGRVDEEEYLTDTADVVDSTRVARGDENDRFVLGIGFTPLDRGRSRFTISAGMRAGLPPEPYVKGQYRWFRALPHDWLFRWRQTIFWQGREGLGTTLGLDLERRFSDRVLVRFASANTLSKATEGVEWWSTAKLFHLLSERKAMAWTVWANGETSAPVPLREYGVRCMWRSRLHREWLFGEVGTGVYWPRHQVRDQRRAALGAWVGVSMQFGGASPAASAEPRSRVVPPRPRDPSASGDAAKTAELVPAATSLTPTAPRR